jgi:(S)-ureidoglycine-glyoxylate aminotransferase
VREPIARLGLPKRLLMGSGPSNAEPRVLQAMAAPPIAADDPALQSLLDDVSLFGRRVFQAGEWSNTLAVPGASRSGLEAALVSLIEPGDRVLVGVYGHFGELLCTLAGRHGAQVERVDAEWGRALDPEVLAARVRDHPPRMLAIVQAETSTGVLQSLEPLSAACRDVGTLLLVDTVLSLGGCEVCVDGWGIDICVAGLQKCLGGPPGLALTALSPRALAALKAPRQTGPPQSAYLDLARIERACSGKGRVAVEMSTGMLMAAREALRLVLAESLSARWLRHRRAGRALRAGLDAMGLQRFGDARHQVPMITLVNVPSGMDESGVRRQLLLEHCIEIMAAFGPLRGRVWRIGTMGTNACLPSVLSVLSGLEASLSSRGLPLPRGAAVDAAIADWHLDQEDRD